MHNATAEKRKGNQALVVFDKNLPDETKEWWDQFSTLIAPKNLAYEAAARGLAHEDIENFIDFGNIKEAAAFLEKLAHATFPNGARVTKSLMYEGYELWWIHYDDLYVRVCLPYTQYKRLLEHLGIYSAVSLYRPPAADLFHSYLVAHEVPLAIIGGPKRFPPPGIWLQCLLSLLSFPLLLLKRPRILVYTGDQFEPPRDHSFRMRFIYDKLRERRLSFVEYIRSMEPTKVILEHALKRRRPVVYSYAIKVFLTWLASFFDAPAPHVLAPTREQTFILSLAQIGLRNARGIRWSIIALRWTMRVIGIRAALIPAASARTFHEILACKLSSIPTVGILHGAPSRYYNVYDFMPEYDGDKHLGLDVYGVWSTWWRDYYLANGRLYKEEHLPISGPMRPHLHSGRTPMRVPLRVLFVAEQLGVPAEVLPYLENLMNVKEISLYYKFRSYSDGFEIWLKKHRPDLLERMDPSKVLRGIMSEAIAETDVAVGSHSTAVLEALIQMKPPIFYDTKKWGDCFGLEPFNKQHGIFAKTPNELVRFIKESQHAPEKTLIELREMFFGDPHKNGSAWVVDEIEKRLANS